VVIVLGAAAYVAAANEQPCMYLGNQEYTQLEVPAR
jgi:hypothetical protein